MVFEQVINGLVMEGSRIICMPILHAMPTILLCTFFYVKQRRTSRLFCNRAIRIGKPVFLYADNILGNWLISHSVKFDLAVSSFCLSFISFLMCVLLLKDLKLQDCFCLLRLSHSLIWWYFTWPRSLQYKPDRPSLPVIYNAVSAPFNQLGHRSIKRC